MNVEPDVFAHAVQRQWFQISAHCIKVEHCRAVRLLVVECQKLLGQRRSEWPL